MMNTRILTGLLAIIFTSGCTPGAAYELEILSPASVNARASRLAATTSSEIIEEEARRTENFVNSRIAAARDRAESLRGNGIFRNAILKLGQFLGGGGAILFGLGDDGKNAAYSGAVAAGFTVVDQVWPNPADERGRCLAIVEAEPLLARTPGTWRIRRNEVAFQQIFATEFDKFYTDMAML